MRWLVGSVAATVAVLFAPLLWLWVSVPILSPDQAVPADAALIFGALVRGGAISPLHSERLDTAVAMLNAGKVETLVVSNAPRATLIMRDYLISQGVADARIEVDGQALSTPDTCVAEAAREVPRRVVLISQGYHLPRIALQCRRLGVTGQYVAAYRSAEEDGARASLWTKVRVRTRRHTREALLIWAELLGQYRVLERTVSP